MDTIVNWIRELKHIENFDLAFLRLTDYYFNNLLIENLTILEKFQVLIAIFLQVLKTLKKYECYEEMAEIQEIYKILYSRVFPFYNKKKNRIELIVADQYYQEQLHKILIK